MDKRGKFIVFEGIDGSGKSTQIKILTEKLERLGLKCRKTFEPTYGKVGGVLHDILSGKIEADPKFTASLFVADRLDHILNQEDGVLKSLESGETVLCDRYYFSSYAYQSVEVPREWVIEANRLAKNALTPDITIFIDIPPEVAMQRISKNRQNIEIYETEERLRAVREGYISAFELLKNEEKISIINGEGRVEETAALIEKIVMEEVLSKKP